MTAVVLALMWGFGLAFVERRWSRKAAYYLWTLWCWSFAGFCMTATNLPAFSYVLFASGAMTLWVAMRTPTWRNNHG